MTLTCFLDQFSGAIFIICEFMKNHGFYGTWNFEKFENLKGFQNCSVQSLGKHCVRP